MGDPASAALTATIWFLKTTFWGGFYATKWILWLTWPIWALAAGLGAFFGLSK